MPEPLSRLSDAEKLDLAREALAYVLRHHLDGHECLCPAARSVAESALRLTVNEAPEMAHAGS